MGRRFGSGLSQPIARASPAQGPGISGQPTGASRGTTRAAGVKAGPRVGGRQARLCGLVLALAYGACIQAGHIAHLHALSSRGQVRTNHANKCEPRSLLAGVPMLGFVRSLAPFRCQHLSTCWCPSRARVWVEKSSDAHTAKAPSMGRPLIYLDCFSSSRRPFRGYQNHQTGSGLVRVR